MIISGMKKGKPGKCWTANWFVIEFWCPELKLKCRVEAKRNGINRVEVVVCDRILPTSASNKERTEPQMNECQEDNAEEEEDEQTDEAALNQNKDYRVNIISQLPVQENLGQQPQNDQGLNAMSQTEKNDIGPAQVGVQEKPKKGKVSKKTKIAGLNTSYEPSQGSNAQTQTKISLAVPQPKVTPKKGTKKPKQVKSELKNSNDDEDGEQSS
ncbi:MAG: hypothetical protein EZS28_005225 [Streblomastix strix]|uniref:Uncharacterized protein n=1 Tax=Streblomastix strix TaxID=222440 RepID=A0A5J4WWA6_9EUKA|nr:MAG: hypothetical protein EZS28_005225 [Streblomastix strix]